MMSKHHTRKGYEQLLIRLFKEEGRRSIDVSRFSDYHVLSLINSKLIHFGLVPFTEDELEMELH